MASHLPRPLDEAITRWTTAHLPALSEAGVVELGAFTISDVSTDVIARRRDGHVWRTVLPPLLRPARDPVSRQRWSVLERPFLPLLDDPWADSGGQPWAPTDAEERHELEEIVTGLLDPFLTAIRALPPEPPDPAVERIETQLRAAGLRHRLLDLHSLPGTFVLRQPSSDGRLVAVVLRDLGDDITTPRDVVQFERHRGRRLSAGLADAPVVQLLRQALRQIALGPGCDGIVFRPGHPEVRAELLRLTCWLQLERWAHAHAPAAPGLPGASYDLLEDPLSSTHTVRWGTDVPGSPSAERPYEVSFTHASPEHGLDADFSLTVAITHEGRMSTLRSSFPELPPLDTLLDNLHERLT